MAREFIWTDGVESALNDIHKNSLAICEYHTKNYTRIKNYQKYFRVPIIVLSGLNSVFSVGLQSFVSQEIISLLCCAISLICGIISSLELFIGIQPRMEKELNSSKEFYILACDIFKVLSIERTYRTLDGNMYLDAIHNKYCSLIEQSDLVDKNSRKYKLQIISNIDIRNNYGQLMNYEDSNNEDSNNADDTSNTSSNHNNNNNSNNNVMKQDENVSKKSVNAISSKVENLSVKNLNANYLSNRVARGISTRINAISSRIKNGNSYDVSDNSDNSVDSLHINNVENKVENESLGNIDAV